jgi:hypothetical protein
VPLFLSDDGDTLLLESIEESEAILYNRRDNRSKRTEIIVGRPVTDNRTRENTYWDDAIDYVESLVPIF